MSTIRKRGSKWQSIIRISGHPDLAKSFVSKTDAKRWATLTETKLRRDDAGISSIKFPKFDDVARRYIEEISVLKKCHYDERLTILGLLKESWSSYPINKIKPHTIQKFMANLGKTVSGSTVNRRLDVISSMFTTFKREWSYPVENPVLSVRRPKKGEPRDKRLTDAEIKKLLRGNRTSPTMKSINHKKSKGQIFNLGSGSPIKIKKLIILIRNKIGKGVPIFGKIQLRKEEALKIYPNVKKIKKMINW